MKTTKTGNVFVRFWAFLLAIFTRMGIVKAKPVAEEKKEDNKKALSALIALQERLSKGLFVGAPRIATSHRASKHAGSHNHNKKRNKIRAKMAAKSNQINRLRINHWKY